MSTSGKEKAAILLMSLNEANAREIINALDQDEINDISLAMATLGEVESEIVEKVLIEFVHDLNQSLNLIGNVRTAEKLLRKILDEKNLPNALHQIKNAGTTSVWEILSTIDDNIIAQFVKHEYPQTTALILSKLPATKTSKILKMLSKEYSIEVLNRMININTVKYDALENLEKVLEQELAAKNSAFNTEENIRVVAEIFNNFNKTDEQFFMEMLKQTNPTAADNIARMMFTFDEIAFLSPQDMQLIMKTVDNQTITEALSTASEALKTTFFNAMSQRVARMMTEEISSAKITKMDSANAQTKIVKLIKTMINDGNITVTHKEVGE